MENKDNEMEENAKKNKGKKERSEGSWNRLENKGRTAFFPKPPTAFHYSSLLTLTHYLSLPLTIPPPTPTILLLCIIVNIVNTVCCNVCVVKFNTIQCK